ncbi:MAG: hypothetical protein ACTH0B_00930 [Senegalia sp. (in: firmicutes)]
MKYIKEKIAREYYEGLLSLKDSNNDINKKLYEKTCKIDKNKFIKDYPISTLNIVSYRTFWELLLQLNIVTSPFNSESNNSNEFEYQLKKVIESLTYDKFTNYNVNDVLYIFEKYKISA